MFRPYEMTLLAREEIYVDPDKNARRTIYRQPIEEMKASISDVGLLHPVGVRAIKERGKPPYQLVYGYRRMRALDELGAKTIPVVLVDADEARALDMMLVENIVRQDVAPWDLGETVLILLKKGLTYPDIAERLSLVLDRSVAMARLQRLAETMIGLRPELCEVWKRGSAEFGEDDAYRASLMTPDDQFDLYVRLVGGLEDKPAFGPSSHDPSGKKKGRGRPRHRSIELAYQSLKAHEDDEHDDGMPNHDQRKGARAILAWVLGARSKCPVRLRAKTKTKPRKKDLDE